MFIYDFSTLYTALPYDLIKEKISELIQPRNIFKKILDEVKEDMFHMSNVRN